MRYPIWRKDDHFDYPGQRIDMDPEVVELGLDSPLPLTWQFDWNRKSDGQVTDLRLEDGEITGEVEFFDPNFDDKKMEGLKLRLGGYYSDVVKTGDGSRILSAKLRGVGIIFENPANPGANL